MKKIIDIPDDDFIKLSVQAVHKGQNLKLYIESQLSKLANRKQKATV